MIIDDDEPMVHMLEKFFKIKGYDCTTSLDGKTALNIMSREKFDTILLDLAMPEFSGYDFIDDLEKNEKLHEQNIVVLTASSITPVQSNALLKRGIKSCLNKPVTAETLLHTISSLS
ncbi:MAG TPA: response regulator [Candidatus Nitrosotalea sp.]|nr:response regulator [Candidatus Nitrosotalea sp.]